ncbi:MAG: MFS transporter [bacterium]|nr:MFS transporter [bacterium]
MRAQKSAPPQAVVVVSTLSTGFGSIIAFAPGYIATALRTDLGLDRWQVGLVITVHFVCTAVASMGSGRLTDRWGARRASVVSLLLVALAAGLAAVVGNYPVLFVAAVLGGVGYALVNVATTVAVASVVSARRRTVSLAARTAGVPAVGGLSAAAGVWIADRWSWEWVFAGLGAATAAVALAAAWVLPDDHPGRVAETAHRLPRGFGWFPVGAFLMIYGSQPMYSWSVPYLEESLGAEPALSGLLVGMGTTIGAGAMIVAGLGVDRAGPSRRIPLVIGFALATGACSALILAGGTLGLGVAVLGVVVGISMQLACIGAMQAAFVDRAGPAVAQAAALTMTGYYAGAVAAPTTFGAVVDTVGSYSLAWLIGSMLLVGAAVAYRLAGRIPLAGH